MNVVDRILGRREVVKKPGSRGYEVECDFCGEMTDRFIYTKKGKYKCYDCLGLNF